MALPTTGMWTKNVNVIPNADDQHGHAELHVQLVVDGDRDKHDDGEMHRAR